MTIPTDSRAAVDLALCRSVLYEALAIGFRPPDAGGLERLTGAGTGEGLRAAAACLAPGLAERVGAVARAAAGGVEALEVAHRRLFGYTGRGRVPPYETEYGEKDIFQQPQELADLAGFLCAFGLALRPDEHERIDHVSCQCEFLGFLARKEAHALEAGDQGMLEETVKAARLFLRDHLARFAPAFAGALGREDPSGFHAALGRLLLAFLAFDCGRLGVQLGTATLKLRLAPVEDTTPMGCGTVDCGPGGGSGEHDPE